MRIVILAPVHVYDDIRVFRKEAATLAESGNEVVLYARTPDNEQLTRDHVQVVPVKQRSRPGRFAYLAILSYRALRENADIYHIHNPDTLPIGFLLKALGKTVIYDTHEDFEAEILLRRWLPSPVRRLAAGLVSSLESLAGDWFDAVIVTQPQLTDRIPDAVVIGNPPLVNAEKTFEILGQRTERLQSQPEEKLVLGYIGGLSADRGLFRMLDLLRELQETGPTRLILVGPAVNDDALKIATSREEWRWVDYLGSQSQEDAFAAMATAHVGLILFEDTASHRFVDPNKIYEYLCLALPFVATGFPSWRQRFAGTDVGLFLDPNAPVSDSARKVRSFTQDRTGLIDSARRGVDFVVQKYSWQSNGAPALLDLYAKVGSSAHPSQQPRKPKPGSGKRSLRPLRSRRSGSK
jgi:glycosyltransferase involved in cell wall biosynthesis